MIAVGGGQRKLLEQKLMIDEIKNEKPG